MKVSFKKASYGFALAGVLVLAACSSGGYEFQLKFVIPKSTGKVDHISVFSKTGSFNNMAG